MTNEIFFFRLERKIYRFLVINVYTLPKKKKKNRKKLKTTLKNVQVLRFAPIRMNSLRKRHRFTLELNTVGNKLLSEKIKRKNDVFVHNGKKSMKFNKTQKNRVWT